MTEAEGVSRASKSPKLVLFLSFDIIRDTRESWLEIAIMIRWDKSVHCESRIEKPGQSKGLTTPWPVFFYLVSSSHALKEFRDSTFANHRIQVFNQLSYNVSRLFFIVTISFSANFNNHHEHKNSMLYQIWTSLSICTKWSIPDHY